MDVTSCHLGNISHRMDITSHGHHVLNKRILLAFQWILIRKFVVFLNRILRHNTCYIIHKYSLLKINYQQW